MIPEYQTWENGEDTVSLEKNCVSNSGRYYVNIQGPPGILRTLETNLQSHNEQVYCEWSSREDKKFLTVFQNAPESPFGGAQILALLGEKLASLGYSNI